MPTYTVNYGLIKPDAGEVNWEGSFYFDMDTIDSVLKTLSDEISGITFPVTSVAGKTGVVTLVEADIQNLTADLAATEKTANRGVANGYASLDSSGKVPSAELPTLSFQGNLTTRTTNYTTSSTDDIVVMNSVSATTVTLTTSGITTGKVYRVKNGNTGNVTVQGATGNIDGSASVQLPLQNQSLDFAWDGTNFWVL